MESEYYLGSRITRTGSALPEIKHRIGLGHKRADDLKCLWRGTGISRRRKLELVDSLIGSKILYSLETLNITDSESKRIDAAQTRIYRRALGLAPPYIAKEQGLEVVKNDELLNLIHLRPHVPWSVRVKRARVRLLNECRRASAEEPHKIVLFDQDDNPRHWPGTFIMGSTRRRGTWLQTAQRDENELFLRYENEVLHALPYIVH